MLLFLICAALTGAMGIWTCLPQTQRIMTNTAFNGSWTSAYETLFDKNLDIYESSTNFWGLLNYTVFKEGRTGVLIGQNGWLFTTEEFQNPPKSQKNLRENTDYILKVHNTLKKKDIELLVALIPAKARVYSGQLGRYSYPLSRKAAYHNLRSSLKGNGVTVTDILWIMERKKDDFDVFLRTDTHWSPAGAKLAAYQIAHETKKAFPALSLPQESFSVSMGKESEYRGDLLRYIPLGSWQRIGPRPDTLKIPEISQEEKSSPSLFADEILPVTLVGTSYSANPLWGFEGFLRESFGTKILNTADEGMGPFEVMEKYLKDDALKTNPPKLVVWEIPERYLNLPYEMEEFTP